MVTITKTGFYGVSIQGVTFSFTFLGETMEEARPYAEAQGFMLIEYFTEGQVLPSTI